MSNSPKVNFQLIICVYARTIIKVSLQIFQYNESHSHLLFGFQVISKQFILQSTEQTHAEHIEYYLSQLQCCSGRCCYDISSHKKLSIT